MTVVMETETKVGRAWRAVLVVEGRLTGDRRLIEPEALTHRDLPLPLLWQRENHPGHEGGIIVGRIDAIERDGASLIGTGVLDVADEAVECERLIDEGMLRGVSVDLDDMDADVILADADGNPVDGEEAEDRDDVSPMLVVHRGRLMGAHIVAFPAFQEAEIALEPKESDESDEGDEEASASAAVEVSEPEIEGDEEASAEATDAVVAAPSVGTASSRLGLIASGPPPDAPPASWFRDPGFDSRRGLHVDADGRIHGHIYEWGQCHLGSPPGQCVTVPRGTTDRGMFAGLDGRGVLTREGEIVATGPICLAADHAGLSLSWLAAKDHYAHTSLAVADVACGEDAHGIWVAGMVRPGTAPELVHALRASAPSGDWRLVGGRLELVAILAVNLPGFPALAAHIDGAQVTALVASGSRAASRGCECEASEEDLEALRVELAALRSWVEPLRAKELAERDRRMAERRQQFLADRDARVLA